jgi:hypothetical protein
MTYTGTLFTLLNPFALLGGLVTLALFVLHGRYFLSLKTTDVILERVQRLLSWLWIPTTVIVVAFVGFSFIETDLFVGVNLVQGLGLATAVARSADRGWMITKAAVRVRLHRHRPDPGRDGRLSLWRPLPPRHALFPGQPVRPDHLQRLGQPLHPASDVHCGPHFCAHCAGLPSLELLGFPRARDG